MRSFKNILYLASGKEGGPRSMRRSVELAQENGARLTVLDVYKAPNAAFFAMSGADAEETEKHLIRERKHALQRLVEPYKESGIKIRKLLIAGTAFVEVIRQVLKNKHDLVIKTAEASSYVSQRLFGTTAMSLMRKCPCPVWVLKPDHEGRLRRVLAAVDVSADASDKDHLKLNSMIIETAWSLAELESAELHVIHVWSLWAESIFRRNFRADEYEKLRTIELQQRRTAMDALLRRHSIDQNDVQVHMIKGNAGIQIPELAQNLDLDALVIGTVCRTGINGLVIGNTAERVLSDVDCSVLTLKPDSFETPITL